MTVAVGEQAWPGAASGTEGEAEINAGAVDVTGTAGAAGVLGPASTRVGWAAAAHVEAGGEAIGGCRHAACAGEIRGISMVGCTIATRPGPGCLSPPGDCAMASPTCGGGLSVVSWLEPGPWGGLNA